MKRKKMYEQQREQILRTQFNVEQTGFAVDSVKDTFSTVAALKAAGTTLRTEQKKLNISEIEDLQDDLAGESPSPSFDVAAVW